MNEHERLVYFAGLFDGEGCVQLTTEHARPRSMSAKLQIIITDVGIVRWLAEHFGGGTSTVLRNGNYKRTYAWSVHGRQAVDLAVRMLPYLIIKRRQAEILIAFGEVLGSRQELVTDERLALRTQLRADLDVLNRRGRPLEVTQ